MRILKWIGIAVGALVGLVLIAAVILIVRFDPNDYKPQITAMLEARTGRTVTIDDAIEWTLFPWLAIETGGITVGNHPDFDDTPFATIDSLSARVRVWPLLRREVELGLITIDGFSVDVGTNAAGIASWSDLLDREQAATPGPATEATGRSPIADLEIAGVRLLNGRLLWRDLGEVRYVVSNLAVTTGAIELGEPVEVSAELSVLDVASQRRANLDLSANASVDGDTISISGLELETAVVDAGGSERGTAMLVSELLTFAAGERLTATAGSIDATVVDPPFGAATLDGRITWPSFEIDVASGSARIDDVTTSVNGLTANWTVTADDLTGSPSVRGDVDIAAAPAARFLEVAGIEPPADLDPAQIGDVSGRGRFTATLDGAASVEDFVLELLGMTIRLTADVDPDTAIDGRVVIAPFTPGPPFQAVVDARLTTPPDWSGIGQLGLDATVVMPFAESQPTTITLNRLSAGQAAVNGQVTAERGTQTYAGRLTATAPDPQTIRALLGDGFPSNMDAEAIGPATLTAAFAYTAANDALTVESFALEAFGLQANGNATANALQTAPVVRGRGSLARFDPAALLTRLDQPTPQTSDPAAFRAAAFSGDFVIDSAHAEFRNIALTLDNMRIAGDVSVENFESPRYRFNLATDTLDVDRYLPPAAEEAEDGERTAGDIALASEPLERLDLAGTARVGALKLANVDFQNVEATLAIADGRARIEPARTELYGGTFTGALAVDTSGETPTMRLSGQAATLALAPLITALTGESNIRGTGNFDLDLTGTGATVTETLHTAAGRLSFSLTDGALDGFNLGRAICAAYNLRESLPQPAEAPAVTTFELIRASAEVRDGIATTRDLIGRTGFMEVTGTGGMNLADARVDYDTAATLTAAVPIRGCETMNEFIGDSIPLTIEGPLDGPEIKPDMRELVRSRVQEEIRERVEDRVRERLRDLL